MATEIEYINYEEFVEGLSTTENPSVTDKTVVSNSTNGPRAVPANTSALSNTATDSDLNASASFDLQTATGKKKAPANLLAKQIELESTNGNVTALTTYAQNVSASIAPPFDPTRTYKAGKIVTYTDGKTYVFKVDHDGAWDADDVERTDIVDAVGVSDLSFADSNRTSSSSYDETKIGYSANTDGYHASALYDTFVFEAKHNGRIYAQNYGKEYFSIVVFDNASQNSGVRYRKVAGGENTLPTEENPASFVKGNYIAITTKKNVDFLCVLQDYVLVKTLKDDVKLNDSQVNQILSQVESVVDINNVDEAFTLSSSYDETKTSQYANTDGYHASELYDTFVFEAQKDSTLFVSSSSNAYFSIVIFDNASQNSGVRYRKVAGGENTLPTEGNPASFVKGNYIAITTAKNVGFAVICNDYKEERTLENDILFSQGQINQIVALQKSKVVCRFVNSSGDGSSTQRFEIFVPAKVGYVKYQFVHSVSIGKNSDCWRIQSAVAVDDNFAYRYDLTKNGEWECAIRLVGREDFSGGITHGNEVLVDASFWADGEKLDLQTLTSDPFFCSKFRIATSSHLYDNADGTTNFADHGCEHIFSKDGCEIVQSVKFIVASDIYTAYLAMGLPSAGVTDHYIVDFDINGGVAAPASQKIITSDLQKFFVYGDNSGVAFTMELLKNYPFLQNPYRGLLVHSGYNKTYFVIRYNESYSVAAKALWLSRHRVNFEVGK